MKRIHAFLVLLMLQACAQAELAPLPKPTTPRQPVCVIANRGYLCDDVKGASIKARARAEVKGWLCTPPKGWVDLQADPRVH